MQEYSNTALASSKTDIKLLFIPVIFLLLRVWTTFVDVIAFYTRNFDIHYRCNIANAVLLFMQVSTSTVWGGGGGGGGGFGNQLDFY